MSEDNPYAPPKAGEGEGKTTKQKRAPAGDIDEALERLNAHLSDPANVAADLHAAGGRLRTVTVVLIAIAALMIPVLAMRIDSAPGPLKLLVLVGTIVSVLLALALLLADLLTPRRALPISAEETARAFLRAMGMGRHGYAWACLSPTARAQTVRSPNLAPIPTTSGTFTLRSAADMKAFAATFTRTGAGNVRAMAVRRASVVDDQGDVATLEIQALFQAWPQWVIIVAAVVGVPLGAAGAAVWAVLFLVLRKTREVTFQKTLLRGKNGLWYAYAADPFDGQIPPL